MAIYLTTGKPGAGMSFCSPPVENSNLPGASGGTDGQGACTRCVKHLCAMPCIVCAMYANETKNPLGSINRDMTGLRMVRKGCTVDYYGLRVIVQKVRKGNALGKTVIAGEWFNRPCRVLKVVS